MPRLQVYLPQDLYDELKARDLPASQLLQQAVRAELRRRDLVTAADRSLAELIEEVGEPSPEDVAWAEGIVDRIEDGRTKRAG